ncbi:hypothetical protein TYRP_023562 [Tyrophagus putrescentiae]|nr:hypothetical protein TYRP_023562 [Tyrophagus putrescentiae]
MNTDQCSLLSNSLRFGSHLHSNSGSPACFPLSVKPARFKNGLRWAIGSPAAQAQNEHCRVVLVVVLVVVPADRAAAVAVAVYRWRLVLQQHCQHGGQGQHGQGQHGQGQHCLVVDERPFVCVAVEKIV